MNIFVYAEDWGVVAGRMTREYGHRFAVLNMANAYRQGGFEGAKAQEENMMARTDCKLFMDYGKPYPAEMTRLLSAVDGRVYLDVDNPRTCKRGVDGEVLPTSSWFQFYELRAAAQDLSVGIRFDPTEMRKRISAQLDTLIDANIKHAVLGAFGCGVFRNPPREVAGIYKDELSKREDRFNVISFAIIDSKTWGVFKETF